MLKYNQFINEDVKDKSLKLVLYQDIIKLLAHGGLKDNVIAKALLDNCKTDDSTNFINSTNESDTITYASIEKISEVIPKFVKPKVGDKLIVKVKDKMNLSDEEYDYLMSHKRLEIKKVEDKYKDVYVDVGYRKENGEETFFNFRRFVFADKIIKHIHDENINALTERDLDKILNSKITQTMKVGKFVKQVFGDKYTAKEYETFVNTYKAEVLDVFKNFELVEGDAIAHWYNCNNNIKTGKSNNLNGSCMRERNADFFDIYTKNPDKVKMLILKDTDDPKKICGRAIVWYLDEPKNRVLLDTIYVTEQYMFDLYKNYARQDNWIIKTRQAYDKTDYIVDGNVVDIELNVQLPPKQYNKYPFVDTLSYYNPKTGLLSNVRHNGAYGLRNTGGGIG